MLQQECECSKSIHVVALNQQQLTHVMQCTCQLALAPEYPRQEQMRVRVGGLESN